QPVALAGRAHGDPDDGAGQVMPDQVAEARGSTETEDGTVGPDEPVALAAGAGGDPHDRGAEVGCPGRAEEPCVPEGEDAAVRGEEPVAPAGMGCRHRHD